MFYVAHQYQYRQTGSPLGTGVVHHHSAAVLNTPTVQRPRHRATLILSTRKLGKFQCAAFLARQYLISHRRWVKFYVAASGKRGYAYIRTKGDKQVGLDLALKNPVTPACHQQTVRLGVRLY